MPRELNLIIHSCSQCPYLGFDDYARAGYVWDCRHNDFNDNKLEHPRCGLDKFDRDNKVHPGCPLDEMFCGRRHFRVDRTCPNCNSDKVIMDDNMFECLSCRSQFR